MSDCIFCRIVKGEISAKVVDQNEKVMAFRDLNPMAPTHILVVPKVHLPSVNALDEKNASLMADMTLMAQKLAKEAKLEEGYRLVLNTGAMAGQSVFHLHMHLLGGRAFHWPPG